jgi:hypothetical protein
MRSDLGMAEFLRLEDGEASEAGQDAGHSQKRWPAGPCLPVIGYLYGIFTSGCQIIFPYRNYVNWEISAFCRACGKSSSRCNSLTTDDTDHTDEQQAEVSSYYQCDHPWFS